MYIIHYRHMCIVHRGCGIDFFECIITLECVWDVDLSYTNSQRAHTHTDSDIYLGYYVVYDKQTEEIKTIILFSKKTK